jgi:Zn-dependent protease
VKSTLNASIRLRIAIGGHTSVPVLVRSSVLLVLAAVTVAMAVGALPESAPGYPDSVYWPVAVLIGALVMVSLAVHELGHAVVARGRNITAQDITLSCFGGTVQFTTDSPTPKTEFLISAAGPAANLGLGALWTGAVIAGDMLAMPVVLSVALVWLALLNVLLALLNLLPGESMDGGQMLTALLWHVAGNRDRATAMTAHVARRTGAALVLTGLAVVFGVGSASGLWLVLPGLLLLSQKNLRSVPATKSTPGR